MLDVSVVKMCVCVQLDQVGWQLNLQMGGSCQSKLTAAHAVLDVGLRAEDGDEVNLHSQTCLTFIDLKVSLHNKHKCSCAVIPHRLCWWRCGCTNEVCEEMCGFFK